ncbi:hypothetical protein [Sinomicrobium soli]|uniref:hypothetical protein n=1 Tax=Sinomicrobium sp. N-1-3-6 TaxID=2219864 RepID=UPI000DCB0168|nr:hypothetical protein [Sinomicrobium sp. N-1-3-6]RAV27418.1 hypothetical protein DN748_18765 [Sinomicrobium sp. N-1-3-6]
MSGGYECYEICEDVWGGGCVGDVWDPDDPGGDEYCWDDIIGQDCYEECDWIDGPIDPNPDPCDDPGNWNECYGDGGDYYPPDDMYEIILDPSFMETKAECVYNKLNNLGTSFASAIKKFDGEFPVAHLKFDMEDLGSSVKGRTLAPGVNQSSPNYVITIRLNNNATSAGVDYRPNLMVAKTIAHEVIHAEMYRKLLSLANQGNLDFSGWSQQQQIDYMLSIRDNFPGIYDYYRRHKNWQHQQMANHYLQTIAEMTKEFDNSQHTDQFYTDLAWEGLRYSSIYTWSSKSQTEKDRINKVISDYINNNKNQNCSP